MCYVVAHIWSMYCRHKSSGISQKRYSLSTDVEVAALQVCARLTSLEKLNELIVCLSVTHCRQGRLRVWGHLNPLVCAHDRHQPRRSWRPSLTSIRNPLNHFCAWTSFLPPPYHFKGLSLFRMFPFVCHPVCHALLYWPACEWSRDLYRHLCQKSSDLKTTLRHSRRTSVLCCSLFCPVRWRVNFRFQWLLYRVSTQCWKALKEKWLVDIGENWSGLDISLGALSPFSNMSCIFLWLHKPTEEQKGPLCVTWAINFSWMLTSVAALSI